MRSSKQLFFLTGIAAQVVVLTISLFYLHNYHHKGGGEFEEELFSAIEDTNFQSDAKLRLPFTNFVTGEGRVVPSTGYVEVTPGVAGEVREVAVSCGDYVQEGDLLFKIDDAEYKFALREKMATYDASLAALRQLEEGPSPLALQAKQKEIEQVKLQINKSEEECTIMQTLLEKNAATRTEKQEKETEHAILIKNLEKALVEYAGLNESPSHSEVDIKKAHVKRDEASVHAVERQYLKCQANAPISGRILAVNLHRGERVEKNGIKSIIMGCDDPLHLKVQIDEKEAWRILPNKNLRAIAVHKSNPKLHFILSFDSIAPLLNHENKSQRKLELTFAFDKGMAPIYLEEMLDVYIESASAADTACLDYQFSQLRK